MAKPKTITFSITFDFPPGLDNRTLMKIVKPEVELATKAAVGKYGARLKGTEVSHERSR